MSANKENVVLRIGVQNTANPSRLNSVEVDGFKVEFGGMPILFWDDTEILIRRTGPELQVIFRQRAD